MAQAQTIPPNFAKPSQGLAKELESGLSRIQRNCGDIKLPAFKDGYPTDAVLAKIRSANTVNDAEIRKVTAKTSATLDALTDKIPTRCKLPGVSLIDPSCKAGDAKVQKIQLLENEAKALHKETFERLKLYSLSIQLENSGCARTGFSAKLWQTEEQYVQPSLTRYSSFFTLQVDEILAQP
jgi:hypothetical protein